VQTDVAATSLLLTADAVRERAHRMLDLALAGELSHFRVDLDALEPAADYVLEQIREAYPALDIPLHARWRHFVVDGDDRWAPLAARLPRSDVPRCARAAFDLAIVSVLLDAGAGPLWHYRDPQTGAQVGRSEGLAIASLTMFADGMFSSRPNDPLRADADRLATLSDATWRRAFQVTPENPLLGLEGRAELLRRLGRLVASRADVFGRMDAPRPGGLFDHLVAMAQDGRLPAPVLLTQLLRHLGPIWPSSIALGDIGLGDCWRHPALQTGDATSGLVPLHKLSQWLAYSLIEPLREAGITVTQIDGLTGLAEYRNGGLFVDSNVLILRHQAEQEREHDVGSPIIVEWRALTVALLDRLADIIRRRLGRNAESLPLGQILEGGTWRAGRALAYGRRPDGSPPIRVISNGAVF
jgi:hypothetical protein